MKHVTQFQIRRLFGIVSVAWLLCGSLSAATQDLRQQAEAAWETAQAEERAFRSLPEAARTRNEHVRIIKLYERVYFITPHSGYSDDALMNIANLYEDTGADEYAITTLRFLVSDYPASRHVAEAVARIARFNGEPSDTLPDPAAAVTETSSADRVARGPSSVTGVRFWDSADSLRVVVDMEGESTFTRGELPNPPRVYLDIANARLNAPPDQREWDVDSDMLLRIRLGQYDTNTVRVVLDLREAGHVDAFTLNTPHRIVMDVLTGAAAVATAANTSTTDTRTEDSTEPATDSEIVETISTPAQLTRNGDHTLSRSLGLKVNRVVIDPGHGGHDPGTIGPSGLSEAELVLDVAKRLRTRIESEMPNAEVILTREDDTFVSLESRPQTANEAGADLFISIHANSSRTQSIRGVETYFLNLNPSPEAMEIAARENASANRAISDLQEIVSQIMMQEWMEESREFAGHIQKALADSENDLGRDRGVKQAPLVVLLGANMPSILAEISFISNPADEQLLRGDERRQQIADALFDGVHSYFDTLSGFRTAEARD